MHTTSILYRKGRSGTSTVFGVMIFIGIMFTAVIPMLLVMKQADTIHEMRKHELEIIDQEQVNEDLCIYVIPIEPQGEGLPKLKIKVDNIGILSTNVKGIWLNDIHNEVEHPVPPRSTEEIGPFEVPDELKSYIVRLVTDRGNIFPSMSGIPTYFPGIGWQIDSYSIYIMIRDPSNSLHIEVKKGTETFYDEDVDPNMSGYLIDVYETGTYNIRVTKWFEKPHEEELYNANHVLGLTIPMVVIVV